MKFDELKNYLPRADIIITGTASPHFILKKENLEESINYPLSANRPKLLILDLALPRDVDPGVGELKNVDLFGLEDLDLLIKRNMEKKFQEAEKAKENIDIEVEKLWSRMQNHKEEFLRDPEVLLKK